MLHLTLSTLLLLLQFTLLLLATNTTATFSQDYHLFTWCSGDNYTSPSAYESNLRLLLSNLTATIANSSSNFATATSGDPSSKVFGLANCRPDIPADYCTDCLRCSAAAVTTSPSIGCPLRRSATVRYDFCILRYSDRDFFGIADYANTRILLNTENASDPETFGRAVGAVLREVGMRAAAKEEKVAVGVTSYDDDREHSVYGMAWCTRDLSTRDCMDCMQWALRVLDVDKIGGQALTISCALRFETSPFSSMFMTSPQTTRNDDASVGGGNGGKCRSRAILRTVLITVITVAVALL